LGNPLSKASYIREKESYHITSLVGVNVFIRIQLLFGY